MNARILFMSTPDFGVPTLHKITDAGYQVVGVVCQPDKPSGRGLQLTAPPVKQAALALGLPVFQPANLRAPEVLDVLAATQPDLILVAAYGQYIPDPICQLPPSGALNLHPSLLPRWRGASPVQAALLAGDAETGVTIHFVATELDAGDILAQAATPILPEENTAELMARLAVLGARSYVETVDRWLRGEIVPQPAGSRRHHLVRPAHKRGRPAGLEPPRRGLGTPGARVQPVAGRVHNLAGTPTVSPCRDRAPRR